MKTFLLNVFDLYRLRARPLASYRHPFWMVALLLSAVGVCGGVYEFFGTQTALCGTGLLRSLGHGALPAYVALKVLLDWLGAVTCVWFIGLWLDQPASVKDPLFTVWVMMSSIMLFQPLFVMLLSWVGDLIFTVYFVVMCCFCLAQACAVPRWRVFKGGLLFAVVAPLLLWLLVVLLLYVVQRSGGLGASVEQFGGVLSFFAGC